MVEVSPSVLWDACNAVIRGELTAKSPRKNLNKLELHLRNLEKEQKNDEDEKINQGVKRINIEINDILVLDIQKNTDVYMFNVSSLPTLTFLPQTLPGGASCIWCWSGFYEMFAKTVQSLYNRLMGRINMNGNLSNSFV